MSLEDVLLAWANGPGKSAVQEKVMDALESGKVIGGLSKADIWADAQILNEMIMANTPQQLRGSYMATVDVQRAGNGYEIGVTINTGNLFRPSLEPYNYAGVYNIFGLFIKGYSLSAGARLPSGIWHGKQTVALPHRDPTPFVQEAVNDWVGKYGGKYDITDVHISETYT